MSLSNSATIAPAVDRVNAAVLHALASHVPPGVPVAIALSGGRDSVALLHALLLPCRARANPLSALHVHHGLSANADHWALFCTQLGATLEVPVVVERIEVSRRPGTSAESDARTLRYAALARAAHARGGCHIMLGHHRDDQAETLLLQLLRGAGPHGLAGMTGASVESGRVTWLRPLLDIARADIDAYVAQRRLQWVEDESNASHVHRRNAVRHAVLPILASIQSDPARTLARAARQQAEAARLLDDLAALDALDARSATESGILVRSALLAMPPHRARNLLRWFLRQQSLPAPSEARLAAMLEQLCHARRDAQVRLSHAGIELGIHRDRIMLHVPAPGAFDAAWKGEPMLNLAHGRVLFHRLTGEGVDLAILARAPVCIRSRRGGERLQLASNRPRRSLKALLQEAGIPAWQRASLPLLFSGDSLAAVAGLGIDAAYRASSGAPGVTLEWQPIECAATR